jgi:glycosyltransferase involved in cell wall biosynthesis
MSKVAIVMPAMFGGGVEVSMLRIARSLSKESNSVTIVTTEERGNWFNKINDCKIDSIHIEGLNLLFPCQHAKRVGKFLRESEFDVIFPVFDKFSQSSIGMLDAKVVVIPLLRNDHPDVYNIALSNPSAWDVAVANSPKVFNFARNISNNKAIKMVPNGCDVGTMRKAVKDKDDRLTRLIFVGRIVNESKHVYLLPKIIKGCVDRGIECEINIIGDGVDMNSLKAKFTKYGVLDYVNFHGMIDREEVLMKLKSAEILLFTSEYEGLPNVLIESQMCGCVPISNRIKGITDYIIKNGYNGFLVEENNVPSYIDIIEKISLNKIKYRELSKACISSAKIKFSVEVEGNSYNKLIADELKKKENFCLVRPPPLIDKSLFTYAVRYAYARKKLKYFLKKITLRL